ncbi:hypothetical protein TPHA_0A05330 [Tetrapisispora phaffii CBS 4417]|uniref:Ubiquitin-like modifier-activating enzyme ATG7 n=1 Tax=Tetrapisispora phaffii (strain ATCC 24235 / CBS 4417 / NBRC 1672 / NRRL Y-8282 / UCD 70-5) TaxID=1071381 RepID=G8BNX9_TETPH|nr:hypothetical protein TPHA_0A05330 [Tetrapisispora phaffii CBS 4417]CCE61607.1 hypothetical protein TPHA_0A05330 [Tetrapisispora phaffii CBS 4417]
MRDSETLQFSFPFHSFLDTTFFQELSSLKLDIFKLDIKEKNIYAKLKFDQISTNKNVFLNSQSFHFDDSNKKDTNGPLINGKLYNYNTIEEFKNLDKVKFLEDRASDIWNLGIKDINNIASFYIISFADLKKHKYIYWVSYPYFQSKNLSIKVNNKDEVEHEKNTKYRTFFNEHPNIWVAMTTGLHIDLYTKESFSGAHTLLIRDMGDIPSVPTALAKSFLTIIKHNHENINEITVVFVRSDPSSFSMSLSLMIDESVDSNLAIGGWEKNTNGKLTPVAIDLSTLIDPITIVDQSVDLNLKLMKWRIAPDLDLDKIKNSKILLLGAGTLGCYVARSLMGWGVRKITFVDNGTVSLSNPVRQALYDFEDTGKPKAETASVKLKKIFPSLDTTGVMLNIPMIGHSDIDSSYDEEAYDKLDELIKEHDVIYILTDSREARWLPTVLGNVHKKIVINVALGFDSYLVIRHGNQSQEEAEQLGCYFCNDVVAPTDSLSDRTLDQMCTVTRPGVAMMAASQSVEVLASLLQSRTQEEPVELSLLGEIPHQIRGFLTNFNILKLKTPAYEFCSGCSDRIVDTCRSEGWNFIKHALSDPKFVEKISGLEEVQKSVDRIADNFDFFDTDSIDEIS